MEGFCCQWSAVALQNLSKHLVKGKTTISGASGFWANSPLVYPCSVNWPGFHCNCLAYFGTGYSDYSRLHTHTHTHNYLGIFVSFWDVHSRTNSCFAINCNAWHPNVGRNGTDLLSSRWPCGLIRGTSPLGTEGMLGQPKIRSAGAKEFLVLGQFWVRFWVQSFFEDKTCPQEWSVLKYLRVCQNQWWFSAVSAFMPYLSVIVNYDQHLSVSINGGTSKSSTLIKDFPYKPCILGYPHL